MLYLLHSILLTLLLAVASAETKMGSLFADSMVLQRNEKVRIWGTDGPGQEIQASGSWGSEARTVTNAEGKWQLEIATPKAGGPYQLSIEGSTTIRFRDVLIGEVWLCVGQSNMQMPIRGWPDQPIDGSEEAIREAEGDRIRVFTVQNQSSPEPIDTLGGRWIASDPHTVGNFSATAYFFAKGLQASLDLPVGLIVSSWGASTAEAWTDRASLEALGLRVDPLPEQKVQQQPTLLYNAMIHPIVGYTMRGAIWYQGEANRNRPERYSELISTMVTAWREQWGRGDFPFYFVQIAPFDYWDKTNSAFLREAQLHTMAALENSGMVVTLDIGEADNIHPAEKKTIGQRLSHWALCKTYGVRDGETTGPLYEQMEVRDDGRALLTFGQAPSGITSFRKELTGFEVAGADQLFHPAQARIVNPRQILVWSDLVADPVAVRYAFENTPEASLCSEAGLPASSFRTDDWKR